VKSTKMNVFGTIPDGLEVSEPYHMCLNSTDLAAVAAIVNQGIDAHLEAVFTRQDGRDVWIQDTASMRCFLRRCFESNDDNTQDLARCILSTLGYETI